MLPLGVQNAANSLGQASGPLFGSALFLWHGNAPFLITGTLLIVVSVLIGWTARGQEGLTGRATATRKRGSMRYHYVWLAWSCMFLLPWLGLYLVNSGHRGVMWRTSLVTALLGLTEPIYVPKYWNPPSLLELAQRTGFDIESLIFSFAIGGIGCALYDTLTKRDLSPVMAAEKLSSRHRLHRFALLAPFFLFVPLYFLPWNPIYPSLLCLLIGAIASVICRPDLRRETLIGGLLFLGLYGLFMLGLRWSSPGYIIRVWNLRALSGVMIAGIPLEELVFGFTFGMYWTGVYEHFAWAVTVTRLPEAARPPRRGAIAGS